MDPRMLRARARFDFDWERREVVEAVKVAWMSWKPQTRTVGRTVGAMSEASRRFHLVSR